MVAASERSIVTIRMRGRGQVFTADKGAFVATSATSYADLAAAAS